VKLASLIIIVGLLFVGCSEENSFIPVTLIEEKSTKLEKNRQKISSETNNDSDENAAEPITIGGAYLVCNERNQENSQPYETPTSISCGMRNKNNEVVKINSIANPLITIIQGEVALTQGQDFTFLESSDGYSWEIKILEVFLPDKKLDISITYLNETFYSEVYVTADKTNPLFSPILDPTFELTSVYHPKNPDDTDGNEDCTTIEKVRAGIIVLTSWNDESCDHSNYRFACQSTTDPLVWIFSAETGANADWPGKCPKGYWFARPLTKSENDALVNLAKKTLDSYDMNDINRPQVWLNWKLKTTQPRPNPPGSGNWDFIPGTVAATN